MRRVLIFKLLKLSRQNHLNIEEVSESGCFLTDKDSECSSLADRSAKQKGARINTSPIPAARGQTSIGSEFTRVGALVAPLFFT
jgi:hypothetical protein